MKLLVDHKQRQAKMRAHTATHLLHFALDKVLWSTKQAGSLVDDDYLRFDFSCKNPLSDEDLAMIEGSINTWISAWIPVTTKEMSMEEARKTWAKAFFEDKYGDNVRVVHIQWSVEDNLDLTSIELCGGTHVTNTNHIWACKIIEHSSVASGIRRISAVTGTKVIDHTTALSEELSSLSSLLDCQPNQLKEKLEKILKEYKHIQADHASLQGKIISTHLDQLILNNTLPLVAESLWEGRGEGYIINTSGTDLEHHDFKEVVQTAKSRRVDRNRIMYNNEWNFAIYTGTWDLSAKEFAREQGLKWWGSDQFVQGKDERIKEVV